MPRERIWLRPEGSGIGRPAEHSRAEITAAAVALADAEGFSKVSMRGVAAALGTGAASLYRYVASRDELLELMIDHVYGELELRVTGDGWLADVIAYGMEGFHLVGRHPWLADAMITVPFSTGPNMGRLAEHALAVLADHPAPASRKMETIGMVGGMVQQWAGFIAHADVAELMTTQAMYFAHLAADGNHPHIAAMIAEQQQSPVGIEDPATTLERMLTIVVRGSLGGPDPQAGGGVSGESP